MLMVRDQNEQPESDYHKACVFKSFLESIKILKITMQTYHIIITKKHMKKNVYMIKKNCVMTKKPCFFRV
jgi:hypothetical protein